MDFENNDFMGERENHPNQARRDEISLNLVKQGKRLIDEGRETDDFFVRSLGNALVLLAGVMQSDSDRDFTEFNLLMKMYSSNRMIEEFMKDPLMGQLLMGDSVRGPEENDAKLDDIINSMINKNKNNEEDEDGDENGDD